MRDLQLKGDEAWLFQRYFRMTKNRIRRGRPRLPDEETRKLFSLRMPEQERSKIESAAKASGEKISQWARKQLLASTSKEQPSKPLRKATCQCSCCA